MLKVMVIIWWAIWVIGFGFIALNGGWGAWVGVGLCSVCLALSVLELKFGWGSSDDPNDWSV